MTMTIIMPMKKEKGILMTEADRVLKDIHQNIELLNLESMSYRDLKWYFQVVRAKIERWYASHHEDKIDR